MLDNVIVTPRRKRKERVTLNSSNPVKRNRQALDTAYILDDGRGIQIPEEALGKVGNDTAEINELVNARRVLYKFVTTTKSLKMPSRSLFIALLNNVQIVRVSTRQKNCRLTENLFILNWIELNDILVELKNVQFRAAVNR